MLNKHGFRKRSSTKNGRNILNRRRSKGRMELSKSDGLFLKGMKYHGKKLRNFSSSRKSRNVCVKSKKDVAMKRASGANKLNKTTCRRTAVSV